MGNECTKHKAVELSDDDERDDEMIILRIADTRETDEKQWFGPGNSKYPKTEYILYKPSNVFNRVCALHAHRQ